MSRRDLLVKLTFTFFLMALKVGLTLLIIFSNPIGLLVEFVALVILFAVLLWASQEVSYMKLTEQEIWRPVKDYEGLYEVSNFGRVSGTSHLIATIKKIGLAEGKYEPIDVDIEYLERA